MKARTEVMGRQCTADGWRCQEGNGPVRSLGFWVTGRREKSGIANNRGLCYFVLRQSAVQYLVSSFDRCEICEAELILMPTLLSRSFFGVVRMWNFSAAHRLHFFTHICMIDSSPAPSM